MIKLIVPEIFQVIFPHLSEKIAIEIGFSTTAFGMLNRAEKGAPKAELFLQNDVPMEWVERLKLAYHLQDEIIELPMGEKALALISQSPSAPLANEAPDLLKAVMDAPSDALARARVIGAGYRLAAYALAQNDKRGMDYTHIAQEGDICDLQVENIATGFYRFDRLSYRHKKFDGEYSNLLKREILVAGDASIILPYDPIRDEVVLIEQMRPSALARQSTDAWGLEAVAGVISQGETPEETARRELIEEAGLEALALYPIAPCYQSPGSVSQFMYPFFARVDLTHYQAGVFGLDGEDEDIKTHILKREDALSLLRTGEANNAPLQILLYALALDYQEISRALLAEEEKGE